jgi:hypothetical protein
MDGHTLDALADDVGRLRRYGYTPWLGDRLAAHVEALYLERRAPAAIRYRELADEGVDEDEALELALAEVDREAIEVRRRLGLDPDGARALIGNRSTSLTSSRDRRPRPRSATPTSSIRASGTHGAGRSSRARCSRPTRSGFKRFDAAARCS